MPDGACRLRLFHLWHLLHLFRLAVAVTLAIVYFLFQTEPFEEEYKASHPVSTGAASLSTPSVNWESFDKTNAPQAFTFDAGVSSVPLGVVADAEPVRNIFRPPVHPVRDKSPPMPAL